MCNSYGCVVIPVRTMQVSVSVQAIAIESRQNSLLDRHTETKLVVSKLLRTFQACWRAGIGAIILWPGYSV